ncbi:MAG: hypothetical protein ACM3QZ_06050 [Solirubrobacterales bacterium]
MDAKYLAIFVFFFAVLLEEAALNLMLPMLERGGALRENYRKEKIPVSAGITFPLVLIACFILIQFSGSFIDQHYFIYLLSVLAMGFLGFIDDMLGGRDTLGFKGHFTKLLKERTLTTGGLKAFGGGIIAAYAALFFSSGILEFIVNTLLIALFTNSMNLFDLRPGRCIKAFLVLFAPLLLLADTDLLMFIPLFGAVLIYFPYDLKARAMMGDTGSNVLGITLGLLAVYGYPLVVRIVLVLLLIGLHILTERISLTKIISENRYLDFFDRLGRSEARDQPEPDRR